MSTSEAEEHLLKNTIEEEKQKVRRMVRRLGLRLSGLMLVCGVLVFAFGCYSLLLPSDSGLSVRLILILIGALGFVGGLNIMCGLLLLLGED